MENFKESLVTSCSKCDERTNCIKLSDIKSKFIFAITGNGNFYPCLILGKSSVIKNGFKVYFLRQDIETEIPSNGIIYDPDILKEMEVSYVENCSVKTGMVVCMDKVKDSHTPTSFLLQDRQKCVWVPLPRIFLTKQQASYLF
ncbi:uncharacterized protein LOC123317575 [Coccinella septempunctata]|uniref:uncharacterized protein LOC123317575 n=1 Tax=Coccinella septempunctata TaxID=41139 RepID=UPI001D05EE7A|nr:uncharacterized protein LOC123317575 [Coccinella septempunctata]